VSPFGVDQMSGPLEAPMIEMVEIDPEITEQAPAHCYS
jgi:hypothetical protein